MSSSEAVLPRMIDKMEKFGCARPVVGLVIPAGCSFNLDGTSICLSMATLFIAQAYGGVAGVVGRGGEPPDLHVSRFCSRMAKGRRRKR